ncbi:hypothetical protein LCGC14_1022250 [marine sediment metagenome]|uniref:Uncharacterized protein n=1 Tax=marine sediment metagenome TaxID=412755 RepID=A0A0F9R331_9ZZZZ
MKSDIATQDVLEGQCKMLAHSWHEAGRATFEAAYDNLDYDSVMYKKKVVPRRKYINIDEGIGGAFMVERATGNVFCIKAYGVVNRAKLVGHIDKIDGNTLRGKQFWRFR